MQSASPLGLTAHLAPPLLFTGLVASLFLGLPPAAALLLGIALTWVLGNPAPAFTATLAQRGIKAAVILLGFGMSLSVVATTGANFALSSLLSIVGILAAGLLLGRLLRVDGKLSALLSGGTAICGGSAIAALAPALGAGALQTGSALALVFLLNGVALLIFPPIGHALGLSQEAFGLWSALAIHDTSSVAGAAAAYGDQALALALPIKLTRAFWIIPVCLLASRLSTGGRGRAPMPWFLAGFLGASLLGTLLPAFTALWQSLALGGRGLLSGALFLTGCGIRPRELLAQGWRPLAQSVLLWLAAAAVLLPIARAMYP